MGRRSRRAHFVGPWSLWAATGEILNYSNRELDDRELGTHFSLSPSGAARYFF